MTIQGRKETLQKMVIETAEVFPGKMSFPTGTMWTKCGNPIDLVFIDYRA